MSLHVPDVMTPGVVTIVEDTTIRDAGAAMATHRVHAEEPRRAATAQGVVTDLDIVVAECGRRD